MNSTLSELFTRLWDLDVNRCKPGLDYDIDIQGYVTSTNLTRPDRASSKLFCKLDESRVFSRPTYQVFRALLDNYEADTSKPEVVTPEEEKENWRFLDAIMDTAVMQETHRFLLAQKKSQADVRQFMQQLYDIWFKLYRRTCEDRSVNSSSFEHVFVGETRDQAVTGFHNWIQFYLQEKAGNVDYRGYFRRGTTEETERSPRLMTLQFTWTKGGGGKPIGSSFIGTSPEFEIAIFTTMLLMGQEKARVNIKKYDVELVCHGHGRGIGTAYPVSKSG